MDYNQGMLEAEQRGRQEGLETGIKNLIISLKSLNVTTENIIFQLSNLYQISSETAQQYLTKFED